MSDDWIEMVRKGNPKASPVPPDGVLIRTMRGKHTRTIRCSIGEDLAKRLQWKLGEKLAVHVAKDGKRVRLIEDIKGTWHLTAPKTKPYLRLTATISDIVPDMIAMRACPFEVDERSGALILMVGAAAAKARAA